GDPVLHPILARLVVALLCPALVLIPLPARADQTVRCESNNYRYQYCRVDTDNRVSLRRQRSSSACRQGDSWGYDRRGVWVDRGCGAEFRVGKDGRGDSGNGALAAVAGIAIIAAIASAANDKNNSSNKDDVPSWAVGSFS
ncbi:DUF3011 domain-containing protein, partial [Escherichia coli]|uniref:DUF3011 domain-containing protein n=1 Tax=Escherichia coli TaxID=562 RepID=UPI002158725F